MKSTKQVFPNLSIRLLDSGLIRFEDESFSEGCIVDAHPAQIQVAAAMTGVHVPDRLRATLVKILARVEVLCERSRDLERMLADALTAGQHVGVELNSAEHIVERLADLAQDLGDIAEAPEPGAPLATEGPGGQLSLVQA
jgi:hypothetical protein